jgi:TonB family protein
VFSTLLESRAAAETPFGGAALSAGVHVVLMSVALALGAAREPPRLVLAPERISGYLPLPPSVQPAPEVGPRDRTPSTSARQRTASRRVRRALRPPTVDVDVSALTLPAVTVEIDYVAQAVDFEELRRTGGVGRTAGGTSERGHPGGVYLAHQVEKVAVALPSSPQPAYPESLLRRRRQGRVAIEFVIDTLGRVDTTSVRVLDSAHPMFTLAVRDVLPYLQFLPAEAGGRKVPMRVAQPFAFVIR